MAQPPHADFLRQALDQLQRDNGQHPACSDCGNPKVLVPCAKCGHALRWMCPLMLAYAVNKHYDLDREDIFQGHSPDPQTVDVNEDIVDFSAYFHAELWPLIQDLDRALIIELMERTPVADGPDPKGPYGHEGMFPATEDTLELARVILEDLAEDPYDQGTWSCWEKLADGVEPDDDGHFPPKEDE